MEPFELVLAGVAIFAAGVAFGQKLKAEASTMVGELRQLVKDGVLTERHIVSWVEAKIRVDDVSADTMLTHAEAALLTAKREVDQKL